MNNLHIHSNLSGCANKNMTIENIIIAAEETGLNTIAITDHIDKPSQTRGQEILYNNFGKLGHINTSLKVLIGAEVTQIDKHTFAADDETANKLDFVLVSSNHYHLKHVNKPEDTSPLGYANHYLDMLEGAMKWKHTDAIAHPFHVHKIKGIGHDEVLKNYNQDRITSIIKEATSRGIAFEVCPRHIKNHIGFFRELMVKIHIANGIVSTGTDAHSLKQIAYSEDDIKILNSIQVFINYILFKHT